MCAELEKWSQEERAEGWGAGLAKGHVEGFAEGRAEEKFAIAKMLRKKHMSMKEISEVTGLSEKQIAQMS